MIVLKEQDGIVELQAAPASPQRSGITVHHEDGSFGKPGSLLQHRSLLQFPGRSRNMAW